VVVVLSSPILKMLLCVQGVAELLASSSAITSKRVVPAGIASPYNYSKKRAVPSVTGSPALGTNIMKYGKSGLFTCCPVSVNSAISTLPFWKIKPVACALNFAKVSLPQASS